MIIRQIIAVHNKIFSNLYFCIFKIYINTQMLVYRFNSSLNDHVLTSFSSISRCYYFHLLNIYTKRLILQLQGIESIRLATERHLMTKSAIT